MKIQTKSFPHLLPIAALVVSVLLWGGSFSAMRVLLGFLDSWSVMWLRMTAASLVILPAWKSLKPLKIEQGDWKLLIPMVLFQPCLYFLLESKALQLTTSSQAGVISAAVPLLVSFGAWLFLTENLTLRVWGGLVLSVGGVVLLTFSGGPGGDGQNILLGNSLEFVAMVCAAANMVIIKKLSGRYNPWTLTAFQCFAGSLFFLPGFFRLLSDKRWYLLSDHLFLILYLGVFVSLGAFGLYNWGLSQVKASSASSFINLVPVTAVVFGWTLLGEGLTPWQGLASVFVIGGVWLSQSRKGRGLSKKEILRAV